MSTADGHAHDRKPEYDRELRVALGKAIKRHSHEIERRWLAQVLNDLGDSGVSQTELVDAMPEYLRILAEGLLQDRTTAEASGAEAWARVAREHALTRVRLGFDIDQLVHEFVVLRRILSTTLHEENLSDRGQYPMLIADLLEAAITVAVKSYVDSRDYASRRKEAEHIGFITHELRNPLTTARLASSYLRRVTPACSPEQERMWNSLESSQARLRDLIDKTLLSERLEAGEVHSEPVATTLGQLLEVALSAARAEADAKGLEFTVDANLELELCVDLNLTTSAVQNLVDNAVKFTDQGAVRVTVEASRDHIVLHVRDNCHGLSEEEVRTLFLPFRRGHSGKSGTGLGLAIAKRAVEAQGGTIEVDSTQEAGCHFLMTLPRTPERREHDGAHTTSK